MFVNGLKVVLRSLPVMFPVVLLCGLGFGYVDQQVGYLIEMIYDDPTIGHRIGDVIGVVAGFLSLYTLIQFIRRKTVSWLSWVPSLFLPSALLTSIGALTFTGAAPQQPILAFCFRLSTELVFVCTVGGFLYGMWVCLSYNVATRGTLDVGGAFRRLRERGLSFLGPHGASTLLIYVGMQVLLPGIFYAVLYSFVDHAALLKPKASPFKVSTTAAQGMRRPIMLLFTFTLVPALIARFTVPVFAEQMFHNLGVTSAFVEKGVFDSGKAWDNIIGMQFGANWGGAFYTEGLAFTVFYLLVGVSACGLTWAFVNLVDLSEPAE